MAASLQAAVWAQQPDSRPALARRIVTTFDFEQRNPSLPIPEDFWRAQHNPANQESHPGFPPTWNLAVFDKSMAYTGESSIKLGVQGSNAGLSLKPGVLPIFTGADYVVTVQFRTDGLRNARAFLIARLLDDEKHPIKGTERRSQPMLSDDRWSPLSVTLRNLPDESVYLQIDIEVLQPKYYETPLLAEEHHIWHEDRNGAAWFDDLVVLQKPRVVLSSNTPSNLIVAPNEPFLKLRVTDLTGEPLKAHLSIVDARRHTVYEQPISIESGRLTKKVTPVLPAYGWYRATLEVDGENGFRSTTTLQFVWLPPENIAQSRLANSTLAPKRTIIGERSRFSTVVSDLSTEQRVLLPEVSFALGIGEISIPLWDEQLRLSDVSHTIESVGNAIEQMLTQGIAVGLSLARTPGELAATTGLPVRLPALALDPASDRYKPFLVPFLERFGQVVRTWQIGRIGDDVWDSQRLDNAEKVIGRLVPEPRLELPWRAEHQFDKFIRSESKLSGLRILIPSSTNPANIPEHISLVLEQFENLETADSITFVLEPISSTRFGQQAVAEDLFKRAVQTWSVIGDHRVSPTLAIMQPWTTDPATPDSIMPTPEFAVWRTLIETMAGRRVLDEVPLGPGIRALILAPTDQAPPDRGGALVVWRTGPQKADRPFRLNLGRDEITAIDVFGNRSGMARAGELADAGDTPLVPFADPVTINAAPMIYEGVDVELLLFLARLSMTPKLLDSQFLQHGCELTITNPWPQRISGQISVISPGGFEQGRGRDKSWRISPRAFDFNLAPGQEVAIPFGVEFELSQESAEVLLELEMEILAEHAIRLTHGLPFRIGLSTLEQSLSYYYANAGDNESIVLEARYKNTGSEDITVEIGSYLQGAGRRTASIGSLAPGQQATRRFVYSDVDKVAGHTINVTATVAGDGGRLNNRITIE